jgi:hypothetical protein
VRIIRTVGVDRVRELASRVMNIPQNRMDPYYSLALGVSSQNSTDLAALDAFAAGEGARPATWTLWSTWGDRGGRWACIEGLGTCSFPKGIARGLRDKGITPIIYWQPTDPSDPGRGRYERLRRIVMGKHDTYIRDWARAAKAYGGPVVVRFAHEMNGNWFPWSLLNFDNSPATFQAAWRHIVRQFRAVGARNCPSLHSVQRCRTAARHAMPSSIRAAAWTTSASRPSAGATSVEHPGRLLRALAELSAHPDRPPAVRQAGDHARDGSLVGRRQGSLAHRGLPLRDGTGQPSRRWCTSTTT